MQRALYLTTTTFLSEHRRVVSQDFIGETPTEVLNCLAKRFRGNEYEDLLNGLPIETEDGRKQIKILPLLPTSKIGNITHKRKKEMPMAPKATKTKTLTWGADLKRLREAAGLTQNDVSKALGFDYNIASVFEAERRVMQLEERDKFAALVKSDLPANLPVRSAADLRKKPGPKPGKKVKRGNPTNKAKSKVVAKPQQHEASVPMSMSAPITPTPLKVSGILGNSAAKSAIVEHITKTINSPKLSDAQASKLMGLFDNLTVLVLTRD